MSKTKTPIDQIRAGIEGGNWGQVCDGFRALTGDRVKPPPSDTTLLSDVAVQLRDLAQRISPLNAGASTTPRPKRQPKRPPTAAKEPVEEEEPATPPPASPPQADEPGLPRDRRPCTTGPYVPPQGPNRFVDTGALASALIKASRKQAKRAAKMEPVEPRPAPVKVWVTCSKCRKKCKVSPELAQVKMGPDDRPSLWKCDSCV